jgi:hypothetical protein
VARALGRDHHDVDVVGRLDGLEVNTEAVRHAQDFAGMQVRLDLRFVEFALGLVGGEDLDPVGALGRLIRRHYYHAVGSRLLRRGAVRVEANDHLVSAIAQVLRLGMALAAIAENGDGLTL